MQHMPASANGAADVYCPLDWGCLKSLKLVLQALKCKQHSGNATLQAAEAAGVKYLHA